MDIWERVSLAFFVILGWESLKMLWREFRRQMQLSDPPDWHIHGLLKEPFAVFVDDLRKACLRAAEKVAVRLPEESQKAALDGIEQYYIECIDKLMQMHRIATVYALNCNKLSNARPYSARTKDGGYGKRGVA